MNLEKKCGPTQKGQARRPLAKGKVIEIMRVREVKTLFVSLLVACSVLLAGPAVAERGQGQGKRGERSPEQRIQHLSEKLDLTPEQVTQVKAIFESHKGELDQLREQMKSTFTEEQRAAMKEMRKNRKKGGEKPSKEDRKAKLAELGISQGQMEQMKSLGQQMKSIREGIKNEMAAVLTPEQQSKLEEMKKSRKGKRGHRRQGGQRTSPSDNS